MSRSGEWVLQVRPFLLDTPAECILMFVTDFFIILSIDCMVSCAKNIPCWLKLPDLLMLRVLALYQNSACICETPITWFATYNASEKRLSILLHILLVSEGILKIYCLIVVSLQQNGKLLFLQCVSHLTFDCSNCCYPRKRHDCMRHWK